jgi:hypothetical protein
MKGKERKQPSHNFTYTSYILIDNNRVMHFMHARREPSSCPINSRQPHKKNQAPICIFPDLSPRVPHASALQAQQLQKMLGQSFGKRACRLGDTFLLLPTLSPLREKKESE